LEDPNMPGCAPICTSKLDQIGISGWFWGAHVSMLAGMVLDVQFYPHVFMAISLPVVQ